MDINKLVSNELSKQYLTNTFTGGMNTDVSSSILPAEQYRYAENIRIVTSDDSSTGEVKLIDGTTEIPITGVVGSGYKYTILALDSIRDLGVLIVKRDDTLLSDDERYNGWAVFTFKKEGNSYAATQNTDWFHDTDEERIWPDDWDGKSKPITTVLRWESEKNIKLYIADGRHNIMVVQLYDNNRNKSFNKLFAYSRQALPKLDVSVLNTFSGTIKAGVVLYAYRLYKKYGQSSLISPLSSPLSLYKNETTGYGLEKYSNNAVRISLPSTNLTDLTYIQIYRINFVINGQLPEIHLIKDQTIGAAQSTVDYGTNIKLIDSAEFLSMYSLDIKPTLIESKGDYMYGANLAYGVEDIEKEFEDFDARCFSSGNFNTDISYTDYDRSVSYHTGDVVLYENKLYIAQGFTSQPPTATAYWTRYNVFDEALNSNAGLPTEKLGHLQFQSLEDITKNWNSNFWFMDDFVTIGGIGKCLKWEFLYNTYPLSDENQTGSVQDSYRTYRRGEIYRFGIKLYDKYGHSSSIKWIADIKIPYADYNIFVDEESEGIECAPYWIEGEAVLVGIKFTPINIDQYWNDIYAYEIVQSPRTVTDRRCITQGIVAFPITDQENNYPIIYPTGLFTTDTVTYNLREYVDCTNIAPQIVAGLSYSRVDTSHDPNIGLKYLSELASNVLMFASPEYVNQPDDLKALMDLGGVYIKPIIQYSPANLDTLSMDVCFTTDKDTVISMHKTNNPGGYFYKVDTSDIFPAYEINTDVVSFNRSYTANEYTDNLYVNSDGEGTFRTNYANNMVSTKYGNLYKYNYLNYITPSIYSARYITLGNLDDTIREVSYVDSPKWDDFIKGDQLTYTNNQINIGPYTFINWSVAPMDYFVRDNPQSGRNNIITGTDNRGDGWPDDPRAYKPTAVAFTGGLYSPLSSGGKTMLLMNNNGTAFAFLHTNASVSHGIGPAITVVNLCRNIVPYGGYNDTAIRNSEYLSLGNYVKLRENDGTLSGTVDISVYTGDAFFKYFVYNAGHDQHNSQYTKFCNVATIYSVPIEMDIDAQGQFSGSIFKPTSGNYRILDTASQYDTYIQDEDAYMYNTAYNVMPNVVTWNAEDVYEQTLVNYDTRVHVSQQKENNEEIDNFMLFRTTDFLDVDSRYGEITGLKTYDNTLVFWQKAATGIISSNERTILKDENSALIQLGSGSVLERYDYISTIYGMKPNQHGTTQSNSNLYWWDGYNKEILTFRRQSAVTPLTTLKQVRSYINKNEESNTPTLYYDNKYKEVVCNVVNNEALIYNELTEAFTSIYKFTPEWYTLMITDLIVSKQNLSNELYLYNTSENNSAMLFGEEIHPMIKFIVNSQAVYNKVFDLQTFGGCFYNNDDLYKSKLNFKYNTPLKLQSEGNGNDILSDIEYDFRLAIPRNNNDIYGGRMRGKFMECEINSDSNNLDFSLHYIITKFRISWT